MKLRNLIYQSVLWRGIYFVSVLLLNIMIARYYEASYSGLIYFITNSFALIVTISSLSMESGVAFYAASGGIALPRLANFSIWWTVIASLLLFIIFKAGTQSGILSEFYNQYLLAAFCYISGCMLVNFFAAAFYAKKNFVLPNIALSAINLLLVFIIPFIGSGGVSAQNYMHIYFIGFLAQGCLVAILFFVKYGWHNLFDFPEKKEFIKICKYGVMAFLGNFLFFLVYRVDYWFVEAYCSTTSLGNYIQVSKLIQTFLILPAIISTAIFPTVISKSEERISEKIATISRTLLLIYLLISFVFGLIGYWLFPFVFGNTFNEMYLPFLYSIPGILALSMLHPVIAYYSGVKKLSINIIALLLALVVIVVGNAFLTPVFGIKGAAIISSIGYIAYHIFVISSFCKRNAISYSRFYRIKANDINSLKQNILRTLKD